MFGNLLQSGSNLVGLLIVVCSFLLVNLVFEVCGSYRLPDPGNPRIG